MNSTTISRLRDRAHLDVRWLHDDGERGGYGFVWWEGPDPDVHDGSSIRIGFTTPSHDGLPGLWQGNWAIALSVHFQAAADLLRAEGILTPDADGSIWVQLAGMDEPVRVHADRIAESFVIRWGGRPRTGRFVHT